MGRKTKRDGDANRDATAGSEFKVEDRRHWVAEEDEDQIVTDDGSTAAPAVPTMLDEYRQRAEAAEQKLQEYIEAFKTFKSEQEQFRSRMNRDVDRRVELMFGELVTELLETVDDLDLALSHVTDAPEAAPLAKGVAMARDRFLSSLERHGVKPMAPEGEAFDPNESDALRVDPVDTPERDGRVTEILRLGYRLGERVIRPARVAVGRYTSTDGKG
jgi:molecular chaperone GrpE (heat shock protein)